MVSLASGIILLCVLVIVHEFGHFIFAKMMGVRVLTFSVGFGPKLLKWSRGGTEYCLSAIPLGGYIKMVGESPTDELTEEEKSVSFLYQPIWKKSLIALAGPAFNLILPVILFTCLFFGNETVLLPVVGSTLAGDPGSKAGLIAGDKIIKVNGQEVETFFDVSTAIQSIPSGKISFEVERSVAGKMERKIIDVVPDAWDDPNPVNMDEKVGHVGALPYVRKPRIVVLDKSSPAALAGLQNFDEIVAVNGKSVESFDKLEQALASAQKPIQLKVKRDKNELNMTLGAAQPAPFAIDEKVDRYAVMQAEIEDASFSKLVAQTRENLRAFASQNARLLGISFSDCQITKVQPDSAASHVKLLSGDRIVSVNGRAVDSWLTITHLFQSDPDAMKVIGVVSEGKGRVIALRLAPPKEKGSAFDPPPKKILGVEMSFNDSFTMGATTERWVGFVPAVGRAFESTWSLAKTIVKSLALLVSNRVPVSQMGGPISIFNVAGEAASHGIETYIIMMNLISVNLGLLNLLPIPVLDGGHLMMFAVEGVTRRPLTLRTRQIATMVGLVLVLAMMAIAIFNDVMRLAS